MAANLVPIIPALLSLASAFLEADNAKCFPEKWTGVVAGQLAVKQGSKDIKTLHMVADFYVDYSKKIEVMYESLYLGKEHVGNYTYIRDGNKMMGYMVDTYQKHCHEIKDPFASIERPCTDSNNIRYVETLNVAGVMVDMYNRHYETGDDTFTVLRDTFTIVSATTWIRYKLGNEMSYQITALNYGNVTASIKDESVFEIPKYC